jgi:hypothetical protein
MSPKHPRRTEARPSENRLDELLKNSAGSIEMNVDGSTTPMAFGYTVLPLVRAELFRLNVIVMGPTVNPDSFGGIVDGIANGLAIATYDAAGALLHSFTKDFTIQLNADWGLLSGVDSTRDTVSGVKPDLWGVRWTFKNSGYLVELKAGEEFRITVSDDLTDGGDVTRFRCLLQGQWFNH